MKLVKLFKPLFRIWYMVDFWLTKIPNHSIIKLNTLLMIFLGGCFITFLQFTNDLSVNVDRITGIIIFLLILLLIKQALFSEKEIQEDEHYIAIVPDDFLAINHFGGMLSVLTTLIISFAITKDAWGSIIASAIAWGMWLRADSLIGPSNEDKEWRVSLEDKEILFHGKMRVARLKLNNVAQMKVFTAFNRPKKIYFEMNDGQFHQIKYYRKQDKILKHCMKTVPESKIEWLSYT